MKKRILCVLLSAVLLLTLIPMGTMRARAASDFAASDECVRLLKEFEGFSAKPYWDYSQYTVGYGTRCPDEDFERYMAEGIPEEEAEALLRTYLQAMGGSINTFIDKFSLSLTQNQFDALLLFTFNCGTGWLYETGTFRSAVINGETGNEFLYAIALWCNAGNEIHTGLIRRRLAEANVYLNGVYAQQPPKNFSYVLYNANGGKANPRIQGYDTELTAASVSTPTYAGYTFEGWFTAPSGGTPIKVLDASVAGMTLYAHWIIGESGGSSEEPYQGIKVDYFREVTEDGLYVFQKPESGADVIDTLDKGEIVRIVEEYGDEAGVKWGRVENSGWIRLDQTKESKGYSGTPIDPVTVTARTTDYINLREGPGTNYAIIGYAYNGDRFTVTETANGTGYKWGKTEKGWIALTYTDFDDVINSAPSGGEDQKATGTVTAEGGLCIRKDAGTDNPILGYLSKGDRVEILEQKAVSGTIWGRIDRGWISLDYVKLDPGVTLPEPEEPEPPVTEPPVTEPPVTEPPVTEPPVTEPPVTEPPVTEPPVTEPPAEPQPEGRMGTITGTEVRLRSGPGTGYSVLGYFDKGDRVCITQEQSSGSMMWGKTEDGWVSLTYVKFDEEKPTEPETPSQPTEPETPKGETVTGTVVNTDNLRVRSGPGTEYSIVGYLSGGTKVTITERTTNGSMVWGRISSGWISMDYIALDGQETAQKETGTVKVSDLLCIRSGPSVSYAVVGYLGPGARVTITEKRTVNGMTWGHMEKGWVSMDYIVLDGSGTAPAPAEPAPTEPEKPAAQTMTVIADCLHIRSAAGTDNAIVGYLYEGAKVTILETTQVGGTAWGRIEKGWICMDYVK